MFCALHRKTHKVRELAVKMFAALLLEGAPFISFDFVKAALVQFSGDWESIYRRRRVNLNHEEGAKKNLIDHLIAVLLLTPYNGSFTALMIGDGNISNE